MKKIDMILSIFFIISVAMIILSIHTQQKNSGSVETTWIDTNGNHYVVIMAFNPSQINDLKGIYREPVSDLSMWIKGFNDYGDCTVISYDTLTWNFTGNLSLCKNVKGILETSYT